MTTLVLRFAGPIQTWPGHSRGLKRPTENAPTYSGVSGLIRSSLGISRADPRDPLSDLEIAIRIERQGRRLREYQTINSRPDPRSRYERHPERRSQLVTMTGSPYHPTVITERQFLQDAEFLTFIEGDREQLHPIHHALRFPKWAQFMGRKSCLPTPDLVLGLFDAEVAQLVRDIPSLQQADEPDGLVSRNTHLLGNLATSEDATWDGTWPDKPSGAVGVGYQNHDRSMHIISCPTRSTRAAIRKWITENRLSEVSNEHQD